MPDYKPKRYIPPPDEIKKGNYTQYFSWSIPPVYGICIILLIWYSGVCGSYHDFLDRGLLLTSKLLNQRFLVVKLQRSLRKFYGRHHDLVERNGISVSFPCSWLITGFLTRLTWRVSLVEQELLTLLEYLSSPLVFSGVRVSRSLVLYVCFVDRCLSLFTFSFVHCVVCSSSIYRFWLPFWYLQTLAFYLYWLLNINKCKMGVFCNSSKYIVAPRLCDAVTFN